MNISHLISILSYQVIISGWNQKPDLSYVIRRHVCDRFAASARATQIFGRALLLPLPLVLVLAPPLLYTAQHAVNPPTVWQSGPSPSPSPSPIACQPSLCSPFPTRAPSHLRSSMLPRRISSRSRYASIYPAAPS